MVRKIVTSAFMIMLLNVALFAADTSDSGQDMNTLPWEIIAQNFESKPPFCVARGKDEKTVNFALTPDTTTITLPPNIKIPQQQTEAEVNLSVWRQDQWTKMQPLTTYTDPNGLTIDSNALEEGFYNLKIVYDENDIGKENSFYAIVSADWKKDILAFCLSLKEQIEANRDHQLIRSSIAVSHFDHTMELVGQTSLLSDKILRSLSRAIRAKKTFEAGGSPDFVIGLNKIRLKRFEGAKIAEFVVFVPEDYDSSKKWPVYLHADPARWSVGNYGKSDGDTYSYHNGMIDLWWHFSFPIGFEWKDYKCFLGIIKGKVNIDEDRIYVNGECGNGLSAMALALRYPDQWAECDVVLGNSYRHLAGNALNLPVIFIKGTHNESFLVGYYDFVVKCFQYYGCRHFKHSKSIDKIREVSGTDALKAVRERNPQRVLYTIESLSNPRAYWVKIDGREDENLTGTIDASVADGTILVKTRNVDAYSLDLAQAPVDSNEPVEIVENGQSLGFITGQAFTKKSQKYTSATYVKNEIIHGPVWDVFTDSYVVVYGTDGKDKEFSKAVVKVASLLESEGLFFGEPDEQKDKRLYKRLLRNSGFFFADTNLPEKLVYSHNLIIVGTPEPNLWLSRICERLPVQIKESQLIASSKRYNGPDMGFILIYPNPINPEKYVSVFSGTSPRAMANILKAYRQMKLIRSADVGIFEVTSGNDIKWHIMENFNSVWNWHDGWDRVLAVVNKKHPEWQWRQWIARILREQLETEVVVCEYPFRFSGLLPDGQVTAEQLEADGAICEDPFRFSDLVADGQITYRDLFNGFRNDWIVKNTLDGKSLRDLVSVPFDVNSERKVTGLTIDGLSFVKLGQDSTTGELEINELEDDRKYTVALPYKLINGQRTGIVLKDYEIIGEGYLVPLLKDYLCKNKNLDLDGQLDSMKLKMF